MSGPIIPDAALETHIAVLGKTGTGKSYTSRGLAERLLAAGRHVVIVDPTGAWWGLRTGFPVPIFGGRHGDVEINDRAGEAVALIIVEQRTSAIVDLSLMSGGAQRRFMRGFAHRLRGKQPGAIYLVIDEADEFLPQVLPPDMTELFGDLKWMVRRGRLNGFRVMMVTQRPAEIAKAVLTQAETIVAHRLTAPQDRKAIEEWVKGHSDPSQARDVLNSLASLPQGEAWVWAPNLNVLERGRMPTNTTFDSGRTPEPGETTPPSASLADLDLSALRAALADAVTEPARQSHAKAGAPVTPAVDVNRLVEEAVAQAVKHLIPALLRAVKQSGEAFAEAARQLAEMQVVSTPTSRPAPAPAAEPSEVRSTARPLIPDPIPAPARSSGVNPTALAVAELLDRINPARVTWTQAAAMVQRKATGGNFNAARKWLRESGRIVEEGEFIRSAADAPAGLTRDEAFDLWCSVLPKPAPAMMHALRLHGRILAKARLASAIGCSPTGGFWNGGLAALRNNGVASVRGDMVQLADRLPGEAESCS